MLVLSFRIPHQSIPHRSKFEIYNDEYHSCLSLSSKHIKEAEEEEVTMCLHQDGCDPLMLPHNFSLMMMSKETILQNGSL